MLPKTLRSASRLCGGRRSGPPWSWDMAHLLVKDEWRRPDAESMTKSAGWLPGFVMLSAFVLGLSSFLGLLADHRDLGLGLDVVAEVDLDGVDRVGLGDGAFELDHVGLDVQVL